MDTKITAAIVDDEQGNRENLLRMIGNYCPQIRISAICSSVTEARTVLPEAKKVCRNTRCAFFFSLTIKIGSFF